MLVPQKVRVGIIGSGNIGTDLMYKIQRSDVLELAMMVGIDPNSEGLKRAARMGYETSAESYQYVLNHPNPPAIVFDATSAKAHLAHYKALQEKGIRAIDLTPAAVGPYVCPAVNLGEHWDAMNINMITCGGQATIPMVRAVTRVVPVEYAEIVATIASLSAGPGTRANIDEFTQTTARGLEVVGGAKRGKAIIILNPASPPIMMRDTIFCHTAEEYDPAALRASIDDMIRTVQAYVPGYRLRSEPILEPHRVSIFIEVEGRGDFLPKYAGNLDIMTSAAVQAAEVTARRLLEAGERG